MTNDMFGFFELLLLRMLCCAGAKPRLLSGICIHLA